MKRTLSILAAALLTLSLVPLATAAPGTNSIGVFLDEAGTSNCTSTQAPYTNLSMYLLAMNIDQASGISGWECSLLTFPEILPAGITYTINGGGINVLTAPAFQVGLGSPLSQAAAIKLLTITTFYLGGEIKVGIGPCPFDSLPLTPGPVFAQGDDPGGLHLMTPVSNAPAGPTNFFWVCYVNVGGCPGNPVATTPDSWGHVKTLFR